MYYVKHINLYQVLVEIMFIINNIRNAPQCCSKSDIFIAKISIDFS